MTGMAAWFAALQHSVSQRDVVVYVETHSILWWLLIGLIAGWLAGTVAPGRGHRRMDFSKVGYRCVRILGQSRGCHRRRNRSRCDCKIVRRRQVGLAIKFPRVSQPSPPVKSLGMIRLQVPGRKRTNIPPRKLSEKAGTN